MTIETELAETRLRILRLLRVAKVELARPSAIPEVQDLKRQAAVVSKELAEMLNEVT